MPRLFIPPSLRSLTGGIDQVDVDAATVHEALRQIESRFPGIESRLCDDSGLRPGLSIAVDGHVASAGLRQKLGPASEVHFLPAIGGG